MKLKVRKKVLRKPVAKGKPGIEALPSRHQNGAAIIAQHPQARLIVEWLREGNSAASIARYLIQHGMIDQAVATFTDYLLSFKKCYPELLEDNPQVSLDSIVSAHKPPVDVEGELNRMFRLQKMRLAVGVEQELTSKRLNRDGHREMSVAHDYLQTIAKLGGKLMPNADSGSRWNSYSEEVREDLTRIKINDTARAQMRELTMQFIATFKKKDSQ